MVCVFWCGDDGVIVDFVICLMGLWDIFYKGYWYISMLVNNVIYYDGFMLYDMVIYVECYNFDNLEENWDGYGYNLFVNYGIEGEMNDE